MCAKDWNGGKFIVFLSPAKRKFRNKTLFGDILESQFKMESDLPTVVAVGDYSCVVQIVCVV